MVEKYYLGIDVGGTNVKIGVFDSSFHLTQKWEVPTNISSNGENLLQSIYDFLTKKIAFEDIYGVGFAVPGVTSNGYVSFASNIGWKDYNVKGNFAELSGFDEKFISVINDVNAATYGESKFGAGIKSPNIYMITLGTGIGGGYANGDDIIVGKQGFAGEVGHIYIDNPHNFECGCGRVGCVETIASANGIVNIAKKYYDLINKESSLTPQKLTSKYIYTQAEKGNIVCEKIVDEVTSYLAELLVVITTVIDPEMFVIGGGVSQSGNYLLNKIKEKYYKAFSGNLRSTKIELAKLGNNAGIYGAAYYNFLKSKHN